MFTVKATYQSVTRKFTFQEDTFPTYEQLTSQLYKAFSVANVYCLSDVLFSLNSLPSNSRILIGKEVHNVAEYETHTKPYQGRSWPGAVLRFTVHDEPSHVDLATPEQLSHYLSDQDDSHAWSTTTNTAINPLEGGDVSQTLVPVVVAGHASAAEERLSQRAQIENERRVILDRIRERTFTRTSTGPSIPGVSAPPSQTNIIDSIPTMPITLRDLFRSPETIVHYNEDSHTDVDSGYINEDSTRKTDLVHRLTESTKERLSARSQTSSSASTATYKVRLPGSNDNGEDSILTSFPWLVKHRTVQNAGTPSAADTTRLQRLQSALSSRTASDTAGPSHTRQQAYLASLGNGDNSDDLMEPNSEEECSDASDAITRKCHHSYERGACVYPHCVSNLRPASARPYSRLADATNPPISIAIKSGLPFPSESSATSSPRSGVAPDLISMAEVSNSHGRQTFEEASERVVDLGIDILCRTSDATESTAQNSPMPALVVMNDDDGEHGAGDVMSSDDDLPAVPPEKWVNQVAERARRRNDSWVFSAPPGSWRRPLPPRPVPPEVPRLATWRRRNLRNIPSNAGSSLSAFPSSNVRTPSPVSPPEWQEDAFGSSFGSWRSPRSPYARAASPASRSRSPSRDLIGSPSAPTIFSPETSPSPPPLPPRVRGESHAVAPLPHVPPPPVASPAQLHNFFRPPLPPPPPLPPAPVIPPPPVLYPGFARASPASQFNPFLDSSYQVTNPVMQQYRVYRPQSVQSTDASVTNLHNCGWTMECEKLKRRIEEVEMTLRTLRDDFRQSTSMQEARSSGMPRFESQDKGKKKQEETGYHHASVAVGMPGSSFGLLKTQSISDTAAKAEQWANIPVQPQVRLSTIPPVVASYKCDGCDNPIYGVAHRCLECEDFEFCESCIASPRRRDTHDVKHAFYPISARSDDTAFIAARARQAGVKHHGAKCDGCQRPLFGVRHRCLTCEDFDFCETCISSPDTRSQHDMQHAFFPIEVPWNWVGFDIAKDCVKLAEPQLPLHANITCDGCNTGISGVRHKCLVCSDFDFCATCIADPNKRFAHDLSHAFLPVPKPGDLDNLLAARAVSNEPPPPVVHENVKCDHCHEVVIGVRHKCLDCPDFDLCELCVSNGAKDAHLGSHEFLELATPGKVIVHRVYDAQTEPAQERPYIHGAVCDLCDSRIRGDRYKCFTCPDFDTCSACFSIVGEEHPNHSFVKISDGRQLIRPRSSGRRDIHPATCDECKQTIQGVRYKCLHPDCPDFDLCQACEALPIPVHPVTHPFAKIRVKEAYLPSLRVHTEERSVDAKVQEDDIFSRAAVNPFTQPFVVEEDLAPRDSPLPVHGFSAPPSPTFDKEPLVCRYSPCPSQATHISRVSSVLDYADPIIPNIPPLIPASWTPPQIDWRWRSPPPGPMVVPHMLSDEPRMIPVEAHVTDNDNTVANGSDKVSDKVSSPPLNPFTSRPVSPPETPLVDLEEPRRTTSPETLANSDLLRPVQSGIIPGALDLDVPSRPSPQPDEQDSDWHQFWPEVTTVLKHLLHPPPPAPEHSAVMPGALLGQEEPKQETAEPKGETEEPKEETRNDSQTSAASPLAGEPLLSRPSMAEVPEMVERPRAVSRRLSDYLSVSSSPLNSPTLPYSLHVNCLRSNNIVDGQIFPPGAEFVKSWHMRNDGQVPWPEETALVFVAGERLATHEGAPNRVNVGLVRPGEEIEMICAEMKAPDAPGKYVSYWRLHDGRRYFGNSVWVDVVVVEADEETREESLASSSVIMPPAPSLTISMPETPGGPASVAVPSGPLSDDGSIDSSISLVDVPSSPSIEDDDEEIYHDSRTVPPAGQFHDVEYVVLYDTSSSEED